MMPSGLMRAALKLLKIRTKISEPSTEDSEVVSDEGEDTFLEHDEASEPSDSAQA